MIAECLRWRRRHRLIQVMEARTREPVVEAIVEMGELGLRRVRLPVSIVAALVAEEEEGASEFMAFLLIVSVFGAWSPPAVYVD